MKRNLVLPLVVLMVGCGHPPVDRSAALNNLEADVARLREAVLQEDHAAVADLTFPTVVKMLGGREKFTEQLKSSAVDIKGRGFSFASIDTSNSLDYVESSGCLYSVIPETLHMVSLDGSRIKKQSFFVGVSSDRGATWTFIDGQGIGSDRENLEVVLPGFPSDLPIPEMAKVERE